MLRTPLVGHEVVQMGEPSQKRLLAPIGMMEALHHEQFPVDGVMSLIQQGARHRHPWVCEHRIPARLLLLAPLPHALTIGRSYDGGHMVRKAAQLLAQRKHPQALPLSHSIQ
jgi:hypothetical protein